MQRVVLEGEDMLTSAVPLAEGFYPQDMRSWYDAVNVDEVITIALPSRETRVRLIKRPHRQVSWWPMGGRGMTMPLEDAVSRLEMLRDTQGWRHPVPAGGQR